MKKTFDRLWHRVLRRPYRAVCTVDTGEGPPVVLLHGLGRSSSVWSNVITFLVSKHRVIAFDLLGFGDSPKPNWIDYTVDDHAQAVIAAMRKQRIHEPVILVGHSMGCLIAVRIARLQPKLVERLVLYEMPLYTDVPALKKYSMLRKVYFALYRQVVKHPEYSESNVRMVHRVIPRLGGFTVTEQSWTPYVRSLKNTIMQQTTAEDMQRLHIPMDLIYGSLDLIILRGHVETIFDLDVSKISTHVVRSRHRITPRASAFIANQIDESIELSVKKKKISKKLANTKLNADRKANGGEQL